MIQIKSVLKVADNSGVKKLKVIGIPGNSRSKTASLGDIVTAVAKGADRVSVVKESEIVKAIIVRVRKEKRRIDGSYVRFDDNAAVIIDNSGNPKGTRIFGPVARELRDKGFLKIVSLAPEVF